MPLPQWVADYARRRYGPGTPDSAPRAWQLLLESVYNATDSHTDHSRDIPTSRPGMTAPQLHCERRPLPSPRASPKSRSLCHHSSPVAPGQHSSRQAAGREALGGVVPLRHRLLQTD